MKNWNWLLVSVLLLGCVNSSDSQEKITELFSFPKSLKEVSGLVFMDEMIWCIQDSGNSNEIFGLDTSGTIKHQIEIEDTENIDWEAITSDKNGNLYIGDFGNNNNERKDLAIYKVRPSEEKWKSEKISFFYPEQTDFPAKKSQKLYDCEAFFFFQDAFYLFTKNRSKGFDGTTLVYKIPARVGHHAAQLIGSFKTCAQYQSCVITDAAISPDGKKIVLLGHDRIWLFENFQNDDFLSTSMSELELYHFSQKEGVCFKDNDTLYLADERSKGKGGKLYEVSIQELKNTH